jgi:23S rRNA (pseudouridine1915-N3)-methyltransferase
MHLTIVALGHRMPPWVDAGVAEYAKRLPREYAFRLVELKPAPRDRGLPLARMLDDEAERLAAACAGTTIVALDERGNAWRTRDLAARLDAWRTDGRDVSFAIGSADGLSAAFRHRADATLSLSAMTLPHGLVRVMLVEQLYRAASLAAGHPYHRE